MEQWQKNHLIKNLDKLVAETVCNEIIFSYLLSRKVLARVDVERIKRINDRYEQASALYATLETRENGFVSMARALARVNQTVPCAVFMEGFAEHVILDLKVDLLGNSIQLKVFFDANDMEKIFKEIKRHLTLEQCVSLYDKSEEAEKPIMLLHNTIPEPIPGYVPRSLSKRVNVNPKVYKVKCSDVFVFKGIDWYELKKMVDPERVANSSTQLLSLSARFIILDRIEDWEEICNSAQVPVHMVRYENEIGQRHILEVTTGGSTVIHQFLEHQRMSDGQNENVSISEKDFFEEVSRDVASGICICDLPGMGKSLLLANLARRMKQEHPERVVAFIQLSHFLGFVVSQKRKQIAFVPDETLTKKMLFEYFTKSPLEYFLLTELLNKMTTKLELFFDGFDEIQLGHVEIAKQLLTSASRLPNTRIFVTSRPNTRHELEASLHVLSYDILPFSHANQIDFLTSFWISLKPTSSEEKLREFAEFCVKKLKKSLKDEEGDITGIPLQCRLVAEVFSRNALIFAHPNRNTSAEELCRMESSLADLYTRYFDLRFSKLGARLNQTVSTKLIFCGAAEQATKLVEAVSGGNACLSGTHEIKKFHMLQALKLLFPHSDEILSKIFEKTTTLPQISSVLSLGILQQQVTEVGKESFQFMHRTFAEYLVAEFFANVLFDNAGDNKLRRKFLFKEVMRTREIYYYSYRRSLFDHPVVLYFLNSACANKVISPTDDVLLEVFVSSVMRKDRFYYLLSAIINGNHVNLLVLLKQLLSKISFVHLRYYQSYLLFNNADDKPPLQYLVWDAARSGSVPVVEQLFQLLSDCFQIDLDGRDKEILAAKDLIGLMNVTLERDYEMAQFFAARVPMKAADMIECFVRKFMFDSPKECEMLRERMVQIFNILIDRNKPLKEHEALVLVKAPLVNLEVIKLMLRKMGVDPRGACKMETIVHRAARGMFGNDFSDLCQMLIEEFEAIDLFEEVEGRWTCPLPDILANKTISEHTILKIYDLPWLDAEGFPEGTLEAKKWPTLKRIRVDDKKFYPSLLRSVVFGTRTSTTIIRMKEMRDTRPSVLRQYSPEEYHELVQLLINMQVGLLFQETISYRGTPLHLAVQSLELLPKTLDLLVGRSNGQNAEQNADTAYCYVDLNAVNWKGESVLHTAVNTNRSLALVKHLVEMGADWSIKDEEGCNLAHISASKGNLAHLKYFVELGCDINELDEYGNNVLQSAVKRCYPELEVVQFLVTKGARKENKNKAGKTAYMLAIEWELEDKKFMELLK